MYGENSLQGKNKYDLKITLSQPQPEAKARFQNENLHLLFIVCE